MSSFDLALLFAAGATALVVWVRTCERLAKGRTVRYLRASIAGAGVGTPRPDPGRYPPSDSHAVQLYETDDQVVSSVSDLLESAIAVGDSIVLVATAEHRTAVEAELRSRGARLRVGSYLALDTESTLASLLVDGEPDRDRFARVVGTLVRDLASTRHGVTIYCEMVDLLWDRGHAIAAMSLEQFWNELGADQDFTLLCGHRIDGSSRRSDLDDLRALHSHVVSSGM